MRVKVDRDLCQGHSECTVEAPTVFALPDGASQVQLLVDEIPPDQIDAVRAAIKYCPTHALTLEES